MKWLVLKQHSGAGFTLFGPIFAESAEEACDSLARGGARPALSYESDSAYVAQDRGRYFAIPLDAWQDGAFDYTKTRGTEAVFSGS